jgi:uncharacterized protein YabE (DUF348 family)
MKMTTARGNLSLFVLGAVLIGLVFAILAKTMTAFAEEADDGMGVAYEMIGEEHFVTIYDGGGKMTVRTTANTVGEVLERAGMGLARGDVVEPMASEEINSRDFRINIYRARPVIVVDGMKQVQIMTAASDPRQVVKAAGVELGAEDVVKITTFGGFLETGMSMAYTVFRAKMVELDFYGKMAEVWTQALTVEEFLEEQGIMVGKDDWLSLGLGTELTGGIKLAIYRQGKQTVTVEEDIDFEEKITYDYARNMGFRQVTKPGVKGKRTVTYEIEMRDGKVVARVAISEIVSQPAMAQEVTLGAHRIAAKPLTMEMGRNRYTTSGGILREETYYDLNMSVVMRNCGGGGYYRVREDGVKVDKDGFVIVAAHLERYPRCSVVETSLGLGKVYDTGGFAQTNPEQFDIATDWTRRDGI